MNLDLVLDHAVLPDGRAASVGIAEGRIAAIEAAIPASSGARRVDVQSAVILPGLVDGHLHLDKSFIGSHWTPHDPGVSPAFSVAERVAIEARQLAAAVPIEQRAAALAELAITQGTTHIRSHVDVDPVTGLRSLAAIAALRERYRDAVSIQIVAFPQKGVVSRPGTVELMETALREGADVVGGLDPAGFDRDVDGQLDAVFGMAERRGARIDIHLHDPDSLGAYQLEEIARRTKALGMQGRVAVSHAYALGMIGPEALKRVAAALADSGVAIMTNAPGDRAFPPVLALRAAGVTVFTGNDNVRDAWWPYGDADMLERAMMIGYRSGFYTDQHLHVALELATDCAARVLGVESYGLKAGAPADFVIVAARNAAEAVVARPRGRSVYKAGKLIARDGVFLSRPG